MRVREKVTPVLMLSCRLWIRFGAAGCLRAAVEMAKVGGRIDCEHVSVGLAMTSDSFSDLGRVSH